MNLIKLWRSYWFTPSPVLPLAVTRIVLVGVQLLLLVLKPVYNVENLFQLTRLPDFLYHPLALNRLLALPLGWDFRPSLGILLVIYGVTLVVGATSFVGFKTNASLVLFALGNIFLQSFSYSFGDFHHAETVMMVALVCLAISPSGRVLSVDDLRRRIRQNVERGTVVPADIAEQKSTFARWPLLLIQWFLAIVYFDAALNKLYLAGFDWLNGHTLQYYLFNVAFQRGNELALWLGYQYELVVLLSWLTIVFEAAFFLILIFPLLAWVFLPVGVAFHAGMCVAGVACFYQYVAAYCVFVPWNKLLRQYRHPAISNWKKKLRIRYDTESPASMRVITVLDYFDLLGLLRLVPGTPKPSGRCAQRGGLGAISL